jgi:tetratricopeptide (TPR) repeat protein
LQPDNSQAISWRAIAYFGRSQQSGSDLIKFHALGIKDVEAVLRLIVNPTEAWEYEARGYAHYEKDDFDLAISDLDVAIRLDPQDLFAYSVRGAARNWKSGKLADPIGIQDMSEAIRLNSKFMVGYLYRGIYLYLGSDDKALNDLSEAIRLSPKGIITYRFRAQLYNRHNQYDLAIRDYSEGIRLGERVFLISRAEVYVSKGDYQSALRDYTEYINLNPNDSSAYQARAGVYIRVGDYESALSDYTEYINYKPKDPNGYTGRAEVYSKLGRTAQAEADKKKADELNKKK